jgi:hypothetical protein
MLTFFRKIRKSIIDSSSARKYLLYAIGEIALVVIGILIALQINNWNEWRKDRKIEREILFEIKVNLEDNIDKAEMAINEMTAYNKSGTYILNAITNKIPYHDSLDLHFAWGFLHGYFPIEGINEAGFSQYKNAGFEVIRNDSLKRRIIRHFEGDVPYYISLISHKVENRPDFAEYRSRNFRRSLTKIGIIPMDYGTLLNDSYCYNMYAELNAWRRSRIWFSTTLKETSESLLQLIKEELHGTDIRH